MYASTPALPLGNYIPLFVRRENDGSGHAIALGRTPLPTMQTWVNKTLTANRRGPSGGSGFQSRVNRCRVRF